MTSGAHRVDLVRVAALLGVERLERADPDLVRRATGFAIGGVAPVGHPAPLTTLVDVTLARHDEVWAAAGHPRTVFRTTYDQLLLLTGGQAPRSPERARDDAPPRRSSPSPSGACRGRRPGRRAAMASTAATCAARARRGSRSCSAPATAARSPSATPTRGTGRCSPPGTTPRTPTRSSAGRCTGPWARRAEERLDVRLSPLAQPGPLVAPRAVRRPRPHAARTARWPRSPAPACARDGRGASGALSHRSPRTSGGHRASCSRSASARHRSASRARSACGARPTTSSGSPTGAPRTRRWSGGRRSRAGTPRNSSPASPFSRCGGHSRAVRSP
jgi:hypothetical protein